MMEQIAQRIQQVRDDRAHGSRWLVRETLLILRDLAQTQEASQEKQNFYFDRTPQELVTSLITEQGMLNKQELSRIVEMVHENERVLQKK